MSQKLPEVAWSERTTFVARCFLVFCILNYVVRLFSLSLSGPMGWYPKSLESSMDHPEFWRAISWAEFTVINVAFLIGACLLTAFVVLRECAKLVFKGKNSVAVRAKSILMLATILAATLFVVFQLVMDGQGAFTDTRLGGFGLSGVMFCLGVCTMGAFLPAVGFAFDPSKTQMSFDRQASR